MTGTILGIIGIVLTVGFGIYSIWSYKKSRRNVSLEFQRKECYSLFRDDVNRLNIEIVYNKKPLTRTLILLKAKLLNNGQIDIDKNRIYSPLKIKSTDDFNWLETTITSNPESATTSVKLISETEIQLDWDLLKKDEFIEFEALAEVVNTDKQYLEKALDFYNGLFFDFRITDLNSIQKEKLFSNSNRQRNFLSRITKVTALAAIFLGIVFLVFGFFPNMSVIGKDTLKYRIEIKGLEKTGIIKTSKGDNVKLSLDDSKEEVILSVDQFNKMCKIKVVEQIVTDPHTTFISYTFGIVYIIMGGFLLTTNLLRNKRKKK